MGRYQTGSQSLAGNDDSRRRENHYGDCCEMLFFVIPSLCSGQALSEAKDLVIVEILRPLGSE